MRLTYKRWTPLDDHRLRLNYEAAPLPILAERMGRTIHSIYRRASRLGLRRPGSGGGPRPHAEGGQFGCTHQHAKSGRCWKPEEVFYLEVAYRHFRLSHIVKYLGRSEHAIRVKAHRLGLAHQHRVAA